MSARINNGHNRIRINVKNVINSTSFVIIISQRRYDRTDSLYVCSSL